MPKTEYTPTQILDMRPNHLRYTLTREMALDPELSAFISRAVGFQPRWYKMTTLEMTMVALAWAIYNPDISSTTRGFLSGVLIEMEYLRLKQKVRTL